MNAFGGRIEDKADLYTQRRVAGKVRRVGGHGQFKFPHLLSVVVLLMFCCEKSIELPQRPQSTQRGVKGVFLS
jgi:hypothetical protein